jgi:hypothetical protein
MFCTIEDHEAGYKDLEVRFRSGRAETLRVQAPTRRQMREVRLKLITDQDPWAIVSLAVPGKDEAWMDRLESASADLLESVAFALAFGEDWEKKVEAAVRGATPTPSASPAPN